MIFHLLKSDTATNVLLSHSTKSYASVPYQNSHFLRRDIVRDPEVGAQFYKLLLFRQVEC